MKNIALLLIILSLLNCSTISKKVVQERNDIKNRASDNTKTANSFLDKYQYEKALSYFQMALNDNIMVDNIPGIIKSYADIGKVYILSGDYSKALEKFEIALELTYEDKTLRTEEALILNGLGEVYYFVKDYEKSRFFYKKALKIETDLKDIENQAIIMQNLAKILRNEGKYEDALENFLQAAALLEKLFNDKQIENIKNLSLMYYTIGQTYSKLKKYPAALSYIRKALEIDKLIENPSGIADDYYALGVLSEKSNKDVDTTLKYYLRSRNIYRLLDNVSQFTILTTKIAHLYLTTDNIKAYYEAKKILYEVDEKNSEHHAQDIIEILNHNEVNDYFTNEEISKIYKKYK